MLKQEIYFPK